MVPALLQRCSRDAVTLRSDYPFATQPICDHTANSTDMINFHALLDNQRFVLGPTLSIVPVGVSAQESASVSGPGAWQGASGPMPAPYDGERRVRREGQKGPRGFLRVDL